MSTVEKIIKTGSLENSYLHIPKCTGCGAYLVECDDCGNIKQDFVFEPCECSATQPFLCHCGTNAKIVDGNNNEVKVSIKAKHILRLLGREISKPGSFAASDNDTVQESYDMVKPLPPSPSKIEKAKLVFKAKRSNKSLGEVIVEHRKEVAKTINELKEIEVEKGDDWLPKEGQGSLVRNYNIKPIRRKPVVIPVVSSSESESESESDSDNESIVSMKSAENDSDNESIVSMKSAETILTTRVLHL